MAPKVNGFSLGSVISPSAPAALCANDSGADADLCATMAWPQHDHRTGSFYEWVCLVRIGNVSARKVSLNTKEAADAGWGPSKGSIVIL
jgi:hypothetical protein